MIITITPNPSIDVSYYMEDFQLEAINRCYDHNKTAGGKGLNVTKVLKLLDADVIATGFVGGNNGNYIQDTLEERKIKYRFTPIEEETRTSLAIQYKDTSTEIREAGPKISKKEEEEFFQLLEELVKSADTISISGSLPRGLDFSYMEKVLEITKEKKLIVDSSGEILRKTVYESRVKPYGIKPNIDEIVELTGIKEEDLELKKVLRDDFLKGIPLVMVSLGKEGALVKFEDRLFRCTVPLIEAVNSVGSGDSTIAGIVYGVDKGWDIEDTLNLSMSLGVLNALEKEIGYVNVENLEEMRNKVKVEEIL